MKSRKLTVVALLSLLLCAASALAKGTLEVRVMDENGTALEKIKVYAGGVQRQKEKDEKTDKSGVARFEKLDDDYYRVWVKEKGYAPAIKEFIHLSGDSTESIEIRLSPGNSEQPLYFEDNALAQRSNQLLGEGAQLLNSNQTSQAEAKFKEALTINPSQPVTYQNLGILYMREQKWDLAEEHLEKAVEFFEVYAAIAPSAQLNQQLEQVRDLVEMLPLQKLAAKIDNAMKAQDYETAAAGLRELAAAQPDNGKVFYNLTLALARAQKFDEAREALKTAIDLEPQNQSYKAMVGEIDQAEQAVIATQAQAAVSQADELYQEEQYEAALAKAEEVRPTVPEEYQPALWLITARSHAKLESVDEAASAYRMAIALVPDNVEYRQELADYLFKLERYDDAFGVFKEVWELKSEPIDDSFFNLGQDLVKKGKQDMALKAFESALETNPEYAEAYYEMGMEYFYGKGDRPKATEMLKKYVELGKDEGHLNNAKSVLVVIEKGL